MQKKIAKWTTIFMVWDMLFNKRILTLLLVIFPLWSEMCFSEEENFPFEQKINTEAVENRENNAPIYDNDIVAIVNNEAITMGRLMRYVATFIPQIRQSSRSEEDYYRQLREYQHIILRFIIERSLIVADFEAKGGKIPENYEAKECEGYIHNDFHDDRVAFSQYLRDRGQSVRDFKKYLRDSAIVNFVLGNMQKGDAEVSPAKVKEYYGSHPEEFVMGRQVFLKKIELNKPDYSADALSEKLSKISGALSRGGDIDSVIKVFSDTSSRSEIGWVTINDLIPEFYNAVENLEVGNFSNPVELNDKIYILFVTEDKPGRTISFEEAKRDIEKNLAASAEEKAKQDYINKLKKKAYIKVFL